MTAATRRHVARVDAIAGRIESKIIGYRRDFHRYAESGWTEFRTASLVARRLARLGLEVQAGREVLREQDRMGLPSPDLLDAGWHRAVEGLSRCGPGRIHRRGRNATAGKGAGGRTAIRHRCPGPGREPE